MATLAKEILYQEMIREMESNSYAFISCFNGMTVADISEFRRLMEKSSKRSLLVKQKIFKKVLELKKLNDAGKFFKDQVLVTFSNKDPQETSKALISYAKTNSKIVPSGIIFEGTVYDGEFIKQLSKLPSRHELLTQTVLRIKSPITGFVLTLSALLRGVAVALNEIKKKKETAS